MATATLETLTAFLIDQLKHPIHLRFARWYFAAYKEEGDITDVKKASESILKRFQGELRDMSKWDSKTILHETEHLNKSVKFQLKNILFDLVLFHCELYCRAKNCIDELESAVVHVKETDFVMSVYQNCAERVLTNPMLFDRFLKPMRQMENISIVYTLIGDVIRQSIRELIPFKRLLQLQYTWVEGSDNAKWEAKMIESQRTIVQLKRTVSATQKEMAQLHQLMAQSQLDMQKLMSENTRLRTTDSHQPLSPPPSFRRIKSRPLSPLTPPPRSPAQSSRTPTSHSPEPSSPPHASRSPHETSPARNSPHQPSRSPPPEASPTPDSPHIQPSVSAVHNAPVQSTKLSPPILPALPDGDDF